MSRHLLGAKDFLFVYLFAQDAHMRGTKNGTCTD